MIRIIGALLYYSLFKKRLLEGANQEENILIQNMNPATSLSIRQARSFPICWCSFTTMDYLPQNFLLIEKREGKFPLFDNPLANHQGFSNWLINETPPTCDKTADNI